MPQPLQELLLIHQPWNEEEAIYCKQLGQFLEYGWNHYDRSNLTAHVVTDAWIVNPDRSKVLLLVHGAAKIWITPGGHADGNPDVFSSALREAVEETGIPENLLKPLCDKKLYDVNAGVVPTRRKPYGLEPTHVHFDLCFAFECAEDTPLMMSDESLDLAWKSVTEAHELMMPIHRRRAEKTLQGLLKI